MPLNVNTAWSIFRETYVDLASGDVEKARKSRDFLTDQITRMSKIVEYFPALGSEYIFFGSFARKTKVKPLDDIDILVPINPGTNSREVNIGFNKYMIFVPDTTSATWIFTDDNNYLSSIKILNKIKSSLYAVEHYQKAEIKRSSNIGIALSLLSYSWTFDIVPAVPVGNGGIEYYLIPDGKGNWMRTDPRRDRKSITDANQKHNGNLLPIIRLMKYWNKRHYPPKNIMPYYLETMLIEAFNSYTPMTNIKANISLAFELLASKITKSCPDPKGLGEDLDNSMSWENKIKVQTAANSMASYARNAINAENDNDHRSAMIWWKQIFSDFPTYG